MPRVIISVGAPTPCVPRAILHVSGAPAYMCAEVLYACAGTICVYLLAEALYVCAEVVCTRPQWPTHAAHTPYAQTPERAARKVQVPN